MSIRISVSIFIYGWLSLHNMFFSGNGIVVEPSSLGIAAKITAIGNSSRTRWRLTAGKIRISVLTFLENEETTSWTTYAWQGIDRNPIQILYACLLLRLPALNTETRQVFGEHWNRILISIPISKKPLLLFHFLTYNETAFCESKLGCNI